MSEQHEAAFNEAASATFCLEYQRDEGQLLRFRATGRPFPDAILETKDGKDIGVEFVSVVLPFVQQEEGYFGRYRSRLLDAIRPARPRYKDVAIRLQPSSSLIEGERPFRLPDVDGPEGRRLVREFSELLGMYYEDLRARYGSLIGHFQSEGQPQFPVLLRYFGALILNGLAPDDAQRLHPDEPVIEPIVIVYSEDEICRAMERALQAKAVKGRSYATDILVVHTLGAPGRTDGSATALHGERLVQCARELLARFADLTQRFNQIFFLNAYWTDGRRLYRLK